MTITSNSTPVSAAGRTGNAWVDALLAGVKWGGAMGTGVTLTYSFPGASSLFDPAYWEREPFTGFAPFTAAQQTAARTILREISAAVNITFVEVTDSGNSAGELRFGRTSAIEPGSAAHAYYPSGSAEAGDVWFPSGNVGFASLRGTFDFMTMVHEIGHALGLKHSFEGPVTLPRFADHRLTTVMSYTTAPGQSVQASTLLPLDLLALQVLYGARANVATGNDVYQPRSWFLSNSASPDLRTIWDTGGVDEIFLGDVPNPVSMSLAQGTVFTSPGANYAIAWGVIIENATGTGHNDTMTGNEAGNTLRGGHGFDALLGLEGDDLLIGGHGGDTLRGGAGNDWLIGDVPGGVGDSGTFSDVLDGGAGFDLAQYAVGISGTTWQRDATGGLVINAAVFEGQDTLSGIERVVLADRVMALTMPQQRDLNADLREDLLFARTGNSAGMILSGSVTLGGILGPAGMALIGSGDIFGDGGAELIWRGSGASLVTTWTNGTVAASAFYNPGADWTLRAVADFSGDGFADMFWQAGSGATWIWCTRAGRLIGEGSVGSPGADWSFLGAGDINGDGRADLLWRNASGFVWSYQIDGTARVGDSPVGIIAAGWSFRGAGDLDGDSRADLVWQSHSGQVWAWLVDGPGQVRNGPIGAATPGWNVAAVRDTNGDARADLVLRQDGTGVHWGYEMFGTAIIANRHMGTTPTDWSVLG